MGKTNYHLHCGINDREHLGDDTVLLEAHKAQLCQQTHFHQQLLPLLKYQECCECMKTSLKLSKPCNYWEKFKNCFESLTI